MSAKKTILLADDDTDLVALLTDRCTRRGHSVIGVNNALDAINVIHRMLPDLVCIDVNMPAGNGLSVCEMMAADEKLRTIPVIVLTGNRNESTIRRCHDMMIYYVEKNVDVWSRLEPLLDELLGPACLVQTQQPMPQSIETTGASQTPPQPPSDPVLRADRASQVPAKSSTKNGSASAGPKPSGWPPAPKQSQNSASPAGGHDLMDAVFAMIGSDDSFLGSDKDKEPTGEPAPAAEDEPPWILHIDDDADFSEALKCRLESYGVAVVRAFTGMDGYRQAFTNPPSAILLDYNMPNGQGDYVLGRLKDNPVTHDIPVIVITGVVDKSLERKMYGLGARRFLNKPVQFETLRDELAKHIEIMSVPA